MILCPDSFTAMNARKRLVQEGVLDPQKELQFLDMVLTFPRNCKSSGAWHHRKWLLCYMYKDHATKPLDPSIIEQQLKICHLAAERYPKCYYAWTMRHWLIEQLGRHWWIASLSITNTQTQIQAQAQAQAQTQNDRPSLLGPLQEEFERMKIHMQRNVSDHSTQQHLQQCMIQLSGKWIVQRVTEPLEGSSQLQNGSIPLTSTSVPGSQEVVLQWTRSELAARRQRRDEWCKARENEAREQPTVYRSSIKSILPAATFDKDEGATPLGEDEDNTRASFPWVAKLWISELARTRDLITTYPGHESLWYHLRFVYYGLRWLDCEIDFDDSRNTMEAASKKEDERQTLFVSPASEKRFVEQLLLHDTPCLGEEDQEKQREWADRHLVWVDRLEAAVGAQ
ncbi:hypothetical protein EDD21DRAFT_87814 [Dissophora ornata]|nr:hypothetical protein EDD21DRAFT_87814 [Dissophora ornata]